VEPAVGLDTADLSMTNRRYGERGGHRRTVWHDLLAIFFHLCAARLRAAESRSTQCSLRIDASDPVHAGLAFPAILSVGAAQTLFLSSSQLCC